MWTSTAAAVAYVTVVGLVDAVLGERVVLIGLLGIGPFLAAVNSTPRVTAAVGVYAVAAGIVLGVPDGLWGEIDHLSRVTTVTASAAVAIAFAGLRVQREEALRRVAHIADVAQRAIVRQPPPVVGPIAIAARYISAAREASIGGDLYEATFTPNGVRLIVGDARGKGLDAVDLAAAVLSCFREHALLDVSLADVAIAIDQKVMGGVGEEEFVTALLAEFPEGGGVRLVNCGHHPPVHLTGRRATFLASSTSTVPLGMGPSPQVAAFPMGRGDRLLAYTDGLVEARDAAGRDFPLEDQVEVLARWPLGDALDGLIEGLLAHVGGRLNDDLAVVLTQRLDDGGPDGEVRP